MAETITITKEEYQRLKKIEKAQGEIIEDFRKGLEDVRAGRIRRLA